MLNRGLILGTALWIATFTRSDLAWSRIHTARTFTEIQPHLTPDSLVVVDIDNTLTTVEGMGSIHWYDHLFQWIRRDPAHSNADPGEIHRIATRIWNQVQARVQVQAVENVLVEAMIAHQQANGRLIPLTAREPTIAMETWHQLVQVGFPLPINPGVPNNSELIEISDHVHLYRGVVFTGDRVDKGTALIAYLRYFRQTPLHIVAIDDREQNSRDLDRKITGAGISIDSFHYLGAESVIERFDPDRAEREFLACRSALRF